MNSWPQNLRSAFGVLGSSLPKSILHPGTFHPTDRLREKVPQPETRKPARDPGSFSGQSTAQVFPPEDSTLEPTLQSGLPSPLTCRVSEPFHPTDGRVPEPFSPDRQAPRADSLACRRSGSRTENLPTDRLLSPARVLGPGHSREPSRLSSA